jgi:nucleoside-diphosphate-sugar epimerase
MVPKGQFVKSAITSVLVTGAAGFVGRPLTRALRQQGHTVFAFDRRRGDVATPAFWKNAPKVDHVVHLAARSYVPDSWKAPSDFVSANVLGTARAAQFCAECKAHLIYMSGYLYGVPQRFPIDEDHPLSPNNPYALSKMLAEEVCRFHGKSQDLPVTILRPFNIYGVGQRDDFLLATILNDLRRGDVIRVKDLAPRRDYLFLDDLVEGILLCLPAPAGTRVFNFGSGVAHSVTEVIDIAQRVAGTHLPVECEDAPRPHEIPSTLAGIARAQAMLGWAPRTSFEDGLKAVWAHAQRLV